ncbi:hypothetical protein EBU94_02975 [bacterium]|jgi:hypothetical protein|nr:hypothetical protein [bacterium]
MAKAKVYSAKIKGIDWKFYAQSSATYSRRHGRDSHAITYTKDREVFFNINSLAPDYVRHEIFHAYVASSSVNSADLDKDQMEEVCAEVYGEHGPEMDLLVDQILNFFLR